ncbi:MAG: tRNA (5-methylaminomethyl-2-thiouridine)(34)-methyltransferase MnmD [Waddliaceae bacterium]|jgi:tRNA 5-methylaminomethyl-2-thiouridine biosynthesis bifunctional protein|nr:tRNA (5-methylaminomethyl-2-thiouridine)(34)-methyltransferase MnmD [Waddliaceae bacterium]MBT3579219.1 tRNA (5-methylaminomethyl-2-thiouridine)(34)-methyltransferase MnmD [Waddliaceae bacterium]MBT4444281.1 tRNA (5-methylaminomethyl-2-thiouridine)(34)-methyltransferase MnmD [Waddliaceae bacterium]MBT6928918.1 tRNA (5-methylaminomethyl-2-thiouridine)(34)-methyltransferase MnmD [Waddliaceae bacterium]MBT7264165.1 tRNA (5-methylaminomethyl-2-thiouridine)(34)-methyltransferase MnmD [Waddliaceae
MDYNNDDIIWSDDGAPRSAFFDDIYFSAGDCLAETEHVFLKGNDLHKRWKQCSTFTIAETGFGSGLNFLGAYNLWKDIAPGDASLRYISAERFPLSKKNLAKVYSSIPEIANAGPLLELYPDTPETGVCDIAFENNVTLTLFFGDVLESFDIIEAGSVDAWFLDGFSPAKNPEMWSDAVLNKVGTTTKAGGTFATFTCARCIREGLSLAGFDVEKAGGFGSKRHMLRGEKQ